MGMGSGIFFDSSVNGFNSNQLREVERRRSRLHQSIVFMLIITSMMSVYTVRLVNLQLINGEQNRQQADNNRIRLVPMRSERGNVLDRKGRVLAANRLSRAIYLWPKEQTPQQWKTTAQKLSPLLNVSTEEIIEKIEQVGYRSDMPVRIIPDINKMAFVALAERATDFRGVEIRPEASRYYPQKDLASHLLGYIGEATAEDLEKNPKYPMGMLVGKMGIERAANDLIQGVWGSRLIEVNSAGEELRELGVEDPIPGKPLMLTIDMDLQKTAEKALAQRRGAVVVLDVKTGAILAMASGPSFDPNIFTRQVKATEWEELLDKDKPFLNRALQGYPPGSTFKVVTGVAGIESGKFTPDSTIYTSSYITVGGIQFNEHSGGYGVIGFEEALAVSSNTFFYQVGMEAGPEEISKWGHRLGIGESTNLELLGLDGGTTGSLPTPNEKEDLYGEPWYAGDTVSMSIGQGLVLTTPLELAVMVAAIANGGMRVKPHLLAHQTNTPETKPVPTGIKPETIDVIRKGLIAVVENGTGKQLNDGVIPLTAGKTGTAEVPGGQTSNAMYVAFGPADKAEIAIAVAVENGGYGGETAAPIAHEIFKTYFKTAKKK
jgi:penicillin-binding protein 2